jgi:hypothetical protein
MAMKLLAHVLRNAIPAIDSGEPAAAAMPGSRRWVFRDLVVRRDGYSAWRIRPATAAAGSPPREPGIEPLWPDTEPWCHE